MTDTTPASLQARRVIDELRRRWVLVLAITIAAAAAITTFDTSYNSLQTAPSAAAFRHALTSQPRALAATGSDIIFAACYAALGLIALHVLKPRPRLARAATVVVVAAALFDELENLTLIHNIVASHTLTDGWIIVMRVPGTLKWLGSPVFLALLTGLAVRAVRREGKH